MRGPVEQAFDNFDRARKPPDEPPPHTEIPPDRYDPEAQWAPGSPWAPPPKPVVLGEWDAGEKIDMPPPRQWLLGNQFCRRFLSGLQAPGATGKTALRMAQYLAVATGRPITGEHVFKRGRVLTVGTTAPVTWIRPMRLTLPALASVAIGFSFLGRPSYAVTLDKTRFRLVFLAALLWLSEAPAFWVERRSADFMVPLGYCQLTSIAFFEFQI